MASVVSGVITVLSTIIRQEYELLGGQRGELQSIKDEFQQMMNFLEGADMLVQDHPELRSWVAQVRDAAYDVEDVLDEFVMQCTYRHSRYGVFRKMHTKSIGAVKARHELANQVEEIKKRIIEISEIHGRYKTQYQSLLPEQATRFSVLKNMQYDKRGDALLLDEADLVGIQVPKKELTDLILNEDLQRNVISVVGMGGLGKTTLVKKIYDDVGVKTKFVVHVWITVSESFKLEELFKDTIRQLFKEENRQVPQELDVMDIDRLKSVVKDLLQTKKYIAVFDDVWQPTHWDAVHLAFPKNHLGSRIVITTRKNDVGQGTGGFMYLLSPLDNEKSRLLFRKKVFPKSISWPSHLKHICDNILRACGGLPLAIEVIGSSLAQKSQRTEEWESFYKRMGAEMDRNSSLDTIEKLLSLSYYDLPLHLKNCFLYLSIFPENTKIDCSVLVQLWIAEGFVETIESMTLEEVGGSYLNELVDRSLVQVVEISNRGGIDYIRVHDIIRLIIVLKASEHNIITIYKGAEGMNFRKNVKRLSIQGSLDGNSEQAEDYCKSIRTLYLCQHIGGYISEAFLSRLLLHGEKLLKILRLNYAQLEKFPNEICKLFHIRYLSLSHTNVRDIPKSIRMLQSLQYINLYGTQVTILPLEFQELQHLRLLLMGKFKSLAFIHRIEDMVGVRASFRIGCLKLLQQLYFIEADNIVITEIGKLIHLRKLRITKLKREDGKELCSSLRNLKQLRVLGVYSRNEEEFVDFQYMEPSDLPRLQELALAGRLEKCPEVLSSLIYLTEIRLRYSNLKDDPLKYLQNLPNLIILDLTAAYSGESLWFKASGFPKLKELWLVLLEELRWVTVEENTLPSLQKWYMRACQSMDEVPTGIEYLMQLQDLEFSNMSNVFVNKLENLDKQTATYKRLLQIPEVQLATWTDGRWSEYRILNKETGTFTNMW